MPLASGLCITLVIWQFGASDAGEVQSCGDEQCTTSKQTPHTFRSSLMQVKSSMKKEKWGFISDVVDVVEDGWEAGGDALDSIGDAVEDVAEEAVNVAEDVVQDIGNVAEDVVEELHDNIVEGFGNLANFLSKSVDVAWKMLENIFECLLDVIAEIADCPVTWARQVHQCVTGRGCAISIGYPTCSSLSTQQIFSTGFLEIGNETDAPEGTMEADSQAVDTNVFQPSTHVLSSHVMKDPVVLDLEHLESAYLNRSGIDPSIGPSQDQDSVNESESVSEVQLLQDFSQSSPVMVVKWTDHSPISQLEAHSSTPSIQTSGHASVGAGGLAHVNTDTGNVNFKAKVEVDLQASFAVEATYAYSRDSPKRYIMTPRMVLQKVVMVGKIPVKVALKVGLVQQSGVSADGSFNFELALKQKVHMTLDINFNINFLDRPPTFSTAWTWWDPDNALNWEGHARLNAWFQVAPEVQLTINEVPLSYVWGPKWLAVADVQGSSSSCSRATFALDTTLAGKLDIAVPGVPMGTVISDNCNLMADVMAHNLGVQAASCVTKAAFNFDPVQATRDACDAVKDVVPDFTGHTFWTAEFAPSRLKLIDFPASQMCSSSQNCKHITKVTTSWGDENSWTLGTCGGPVGGMYSSHRRYDFGNCCLSSGQHTLKCMDSYGDGWHGGHLLIDGVEYCRGFGGGYSKTETVVFA